MDRWFSLDLNCVSAAPRSRCYQRALLLIQRSLSRMLKISAMSHVIPGGQSHPRILEKGCEANAPAGADEKRTRSPHHGALRSNPPRLGIASIQCSLFHPTVPKSDIRFSSVPDSRLTLSSRRMQESSVVRTGSGFGSSPRCPKAWPAGTNSIFSILHTCTGWSVSLS